MTKDTLTARLMQAEAARPELAERIRKAAAIVEAHLNDRAAGMIHARATEAGLVWTVKGSKGDAYAVTLGETCSCTCQDYARRRLPCKHIMAIKILALAHEPGQVVFIPADAHEPTPTPTQAPTRTRRPYREEIDRW